ncbi:hypothetical protein [Variovorax sp. HJSM1_2]|uniref:hypothetical protein n=1 Tax=Variovorax sp. HJSM1_2 TaxID=3366263 RepID=UPI003BD215F7
MQSRALQRAQAARRLAAGIRAGQHTQRIDGEALCELEKQKRLPDAVGKEKVRTIFDYVVDSLDERDAFEAEAKRALIAIVNSLADAQEQAPETQKPLQAEPTGVIWRKRRDSNPR